MYSWKVLKSELCVKSSSYSYHQCLSPQVPHAPRVPVHCRLWAPHGRRSSGNNNNINNNNNNNNSAGLSWQGPGPRSSGHHWQCTLRGPPDASVRQLSDPLLHVTSPKCGGLPLPPLHWPRAPGQPPQQVIITTTKNNTICLNQRGLHSCLFLT